MNAYSCCRIQFTDRLNDNSAKLMLADIQILGCCCVGNRFESLWEEIGMRVYVTLCVCERVCKDYIYDLFSNPL